MKSSTMERWVKLLAYLYYHPNCEAPAVIEELALTKDSTYKTLETWVKEKKVVKIRRKEIKLGGTKILYSLTPDGEALFFRLKEALDKKRDATA